MQENKVTIKENECEILIEKPCGEIKLIQFKSRESFDNYIKYYLL